MRRPAVHEVQVGIVEPRHDHAALIHDHSAVSSLAVQNEDAASPNQDVIHVAATSGKVVEDDPTLPLKLLELLAGCLLTEGPPGHTHQLAAYQLRRWFAWCETYRLDPLVGIQRAHIELYIRHLGEEIVDHH